MKATSKHSINHGYPLWNLMLLRVTFKIVDINFVCRPRVTWGAGSTCVCNVDHLYHTKARAKLTPFTTIILCVFLVLSALTWMTDSDSFSRSQHDKTWVSKLYYTLLEMYVHKACMWNWVQVVHKSATVQLGNYEPSFVLWYFLPLEP